MFRRNAWENSGWCIGTASRVISESSLLLPLSLNRLRLFFSSPALLSHDCSALRIVCFLSGSFVLFFGLLLGSFALLFFSPGSFLLRFRFRFSTLLLSLQLLLLCQTVDLCKGQLCELLLNGSDLFLLPDAKSSQPIKDFSHETGHLFGTFHQMVHMFSRVRHVHVKRLDRRNQTIRQFARFVSLLKHLACLRTHLFGLQLYKVNLILNSFCRLRRV